MQAEAGLDNTMSAAATKKMFWLASPEFKDRFGGRPAESMNAVTDELLKWQGKK